MITHKIKIAEDLTFDHVLDSYQELIMFLKKQNVECLCLDLSHVVQCDSAGISLLLAVKNFCDKNRKKFKIIGLSKIVLDLAIFYGLEKIFSPKSL